MSRTPRLALTMGDPAGIGAEVIVKAFGEISEGAEIIVVGDADVLRRASDLCNSSITINPVMAVSEARYDPDVLNVVDLANVDDHSWGELRREYGAASLEYIEHAIDLALAEDVDGIVTAPINKQATRLAGAEHAGHTGLLAERTGVENYTMMLIESGLRVTHVSTHVSLREACDRVTTENVLDTIRVTEQGLMDVAVTDPTIAVAGLNPHASDGGLLGDEEQESIQPAIDRARTEGIDVVGPEPPDTVYVRAARGEFDCVVSMYHDEGHIPIKMLGFSHGGEVSGVNMTVGLPIVRTSVDHGTAFDIAGTGVASARSLIDATKMASTAARNRRT